MKEFVDQGYSPSRHTRGHVVDGIGEEDDELVELEEMGSVIADRKKGQLAEVSSR
jgi:hypothetical protein